MLLLQDNDAAALQSLERLMTEFFSPETTNERKRTIEQSFQEFAEQIDSWRPCLHFLSSTNNHYVSMFALSTLEVCTNKVLMRVYYLLSFFIPLL